MPEFDKLRRFDDKYFADESKKGKFNEDKDEGIFVFESNGEDEDDSDYEMSREPKTEFEKSLSRIDNVTRQIEDDTQMLSHDLKTLQSKNESTERRILKLLKDAEVFRSKLKGFLNSYATRSRYANEEEVESHEDDTVSSLRSSVHKTSLKVLLKQNSIEQPVHVNIDSSGAVSTRLVR